MRRLQLTRQFAANQLSLVDLLCTDQLTLIMNKGCRECPCNNLVDFWWVVYAC